MRIDSLEIRSPWKNLDGFRIDFDERRDIAVIIGRNGSAKSNLFEAIITIFLDLDFGLVAPFSYELKYVLGGKKVVLTAQVGKQPSATVDGKTTPLSQIRETWSPYYLVSYYSGASDRFEKLFARYDMAARDLTLTPPSTDGLPGKLELRRRIFALPVHGLFALIAFFFAKDKAVAEFLKELPRIEAFDSALLVVRRPPWAKKESSVEEFWGAKGPVRDLLNCIRKHSMVPFSRRVRTKVGFAKRETRELVYLFLADVEALEAVAAEYKHDPVALFQALDTMRLSELIEDFRVRVQVTGATKAIHTRQLSEGEQQLLAVLGLMRFTRNTSSLYLLDEPDTHLHPSWEVQYLRRLRTIGGIDRNSHTILATHDPLLVSGLRREELRIMFRLPNGRIVAAQPEEDPRGTGVGGVLTSPLYGLQSQLDEFSLNVLKRIYELSLLERTPQRIKRLARLRRLLPAVETAETSPDPYRNIARDAYQMAQDHVLNSDEITDRKKQLIDLLATKLVEEVEDLE